MTRKELLNLPKEAHIELDNIPLLDFLYIIPTMRKHESGYRCMEIVGVRLKRNSDKIIEGYEYAKRIATFSDVWSWNTMHRLNNQSWRIDIPSDCNCMRIFTNSNKPKIKVLWNLSDFEFEIVD